MENELTIRLSAFLVLFLLFALLESYWPRRKRVYSRLSRWPTHWAITAINALMLRALSFGLPLLAVGAALDCISSRFRAFQPTKLAHLGRIHNLRIGTGFFYLGAAPYFTQSSSSLAPAQGASL